jgi:antitoxin HigA-1
MNSTSKIITEPLAAMKNPSHPGDVIWFATLEPLGLPVTKAAALLGVRRATLSDVINGKASLSAEMAYRLSKAFGIDATMLLNLQNQYDLAQVAKRDRSLKVKRYQPKAA